MTEGGSLGQVTEFKRFEDAEPFIGGDFRVPDVLRSKRLPHGPSAYRGGVPRKPGTLTHGYTGALRRSGKYTPHTRRATAEDALEFERYASAERFRQRLLPIGQKVRPADVKRRGRQDTVYVPLRERPLKRAESQELRKALEEVEPEHLTVEEAARLEQLTKAFEYELFPVVERMNDGFRPGPEFAGVHPGQAVPGVVWVDRTLLGSQRKLVGNVPVYDVTADAVKGLILYGKTGYVTPNLVGNMALNLFQQGVLMPANIMRVAKLPRDVRMLVKEVMGHGFSRALAEGTRSPISGAVQKAGNFWSYFVDNLFREAAFIHEARRYGMHSPAEIRSFIMDSKHRSDYAEAAQRARDAIIDYERLGPLERDIIRRAIFVYPWIKGSTYYAGQFLRDHPILAAVFAKMGEQGMAEAARDIGPVPSYARGSFKVGGTEGRPLIVNPAAVSPFQTPAQVVASLRGAVSGNAERSEQVGEFAAPLIQSGIEAAFGRDLFTGRELEGNLPERFGGQIAKGLPQVLLTKRLRDVGKPATQEKTYPYSRGEALGQFIVGSSFPRPANRAALNEQAVAASRPTGLEKITVERQAVLPKLRGKVDPEDFKHIQKAYTVYMGMETIRSKARASTGEGEPYYRAVLEAEARYMGELGFAERADVNFLVKIAKTGSYDEVRKRRNALVTGPYESLYLKATRTARKVAGYQR